MTAREASSSSSSKSKLWKYDVFLSFRGEDTRNGFTSNLHAALKDRGCQTFMDDNDLKRGKEMKEELLRAIEESRICVIIFSKMYADSSWCLDELVKIMECRDKPGRHVLPIFYHVDPSHVRKQDGALAGAFQKHEKDIREEKDDKKREAKQERVNQWREALTKAANLSGHHLQSANNRKRRREAHTEATNLSDHETTGNGCEAEFIKKIIDENICEWLTSTNELHVPKRIVGIKSLVQDIISYLSSGGSNDVLMVGIWGMGGLGKTTAAKAIYNQIHPQFEFKGFLADVCDATSKHDLVDLQKKLISDILKEKHEISCVAEGIGLIKQQFRHRKILVIVDDIDKKEQLDAIVGSHYWFGPGSRVIITTRDKHLLLNVDRECQAKKMNEEEALELFSWHAFKNSCPDEEYLEVSRKVVSYCGGLPLALKVLGSRLTERSVAEWESQLEKLGKYPDGNIVNQLRTSYEGLDYFQKAIFLDISCFFIGKDKDYVAKMLDRCGFLGTIGINVLCERSLITVEWNELKMRNELNMHVLLREMAKVIISEKSLDHPGKWSRLWNLQEAAEVLRNKSGTEEVEGLALNFPYPLPPSSSMPFFQKKKKSSRMPSFSTKAFANMKKLRFLQLSFVELNGKYKHLPKELIWLCWEGCPLKSIPDDFFDQPRLVVLEMLCSKLVQVWEGYKLLERLKILNLSRSYSLIKSPDFSQVPNLEELILEDCGSLSEIHPSIGQLQKLSLVNLKECRKLISLPRDFYKSKSVETVLLTSCFKFGEVHEDLGEMKSLRILEADYTAIRQIPSSTVGLENLTLLSLEGVKLAHDAIPQDLGSLISLQVLDLQGNDFHTLPSLSGLTKLETLRLNDCFNLRTIPDLPTNLKFLYAANCPALETMPNFSEMSNMTELVVCDSPKLTEVPGLDKSLNFMTLIDMSNCPALETMPNFSEISNMTELKVSDSPKELRVLQDRISNLPHEILVRIVSLLPLKEAAATSILSRPWRHVWAFTTTISFDFVNFEVGDNLHRFLDLEEQVRDRESRLYVNRVDHVLDQHRGQCIDRFRVCFFLQRDFAGSIDKWIQFAMEKRVQILELELLTDSIVFLDDNYTFPHKLLLGPEEQKGLFSNLPSLHPGGYSIAPFESLRVVRFQHVGVTGETLEFLLSNCPVLERLSLSFAKDLVKLRVTGTSMALKYLEVKYCRELSIIEIYGANIVSFIYCGQLIDLRLNNVLLLVEVSIYKWGTFAEFIRLAFSQLSCCLSHLETLKLDIRGAVSILIPCYLVEINYCRVPYSVVGFQVYNQNHAFPALSNLKHLELLVDADYPLSLGRLASFMKAAPYLINLVLGLGFSTSNKDMEIPEKVSKQPHHCLKLVEIAGYRGHKCCVKHVRYLVENAVALEKIIINPVRFWCRPTGIESNALLENEEENARDHAIQHLKKKVPSSVEFVCL